MELWANQSVRMGFLYKHELNLRIAEKSEIKRLCVNLSKMKETILIVLRKECPLSFQYPLRVTELQ